MASQLKEKGMYRDLLRGAFEITWHRKGLWALGFFAAILGFNGGAFDYILKVTTSLATGAPFADTAAYVLVVLDRIVNGTPLVQLSVVLTLLLSALIAVVVAVLATASAGGIMFAAAERANRKKVAPRDALAAGMSKIVPLLAVQILGQAALYLVFTLASIALYASWSGWAGTVIYVISFVAFAAVALIVSFLAIVSSAGIMINGLRWYRAIGSAWKLFVRHWLVSIEMMALMFAIAVGLVAAIFVVGLALLILFTLVAFAGSALGAAWLLIALNYLFVLTVIVLVVVGGSALATFEYSAWALLCLRLAGHGAVAKLERLYRDARGAKSHGRRKR